MRYQAQLDCCHVNRRVFLQRAAALAGGAAVASLLAACAPSTAPATPLVSGTPASTTNPPATQATPTTASATSISMRFPTWMYGEAGTGDWWRATLGQFKQENPGIQVDETNVPNTQFEDKMLTELSAGTAPDMMTAFTTQVPKLVKLNLLEPLDAYLDKASFKDKMVPTQKAATIGSKTYGVVFTASPQGLLVNTALLQQAGLATPPTTIDELFQAAKQIKDKTGAFGVGFVNDSKAVLLSYIAAMHYVLGNGSDFARDGQVNVTDPKLTEGLAWTKRILDEGLGPRGVDAVALQKMMGEGKLAMWISGPWVMTYLKTEAPEVYKTMDFVIPPTPTHAAITGGGFIVIPRASQQKDLAWKYIDLTQRADWQRKWLEDLVQIPGQVVQPSQAFLEANPWVKNMNDMTRFGAGFGYAVPGLEEINGEYQKIVMDHVQQVWAGSKSPADAMNDAKPELEDLVKAKVKR